MDQQLPSNLALTSIQVVNRVEVVSQLRNNYIGINNLYNEVRRMKRAASSTKHTKEDFSSTGILKKSPGNAKTSNGEID